MSVVSQTFPITANGQKIPLNPPQQPSLYFKSVAIYNASGYLLTVTLPDGSQDFLNPSTAALFTLVGNGSVSVQAASIPGFTLPTNNVWAVFYTATDNPGTYPIGLPAPGTIGLVQITGQPIDIAPTAKNVTGVEFDGITGASGTLFTVGGNGIEIISAHGLLTDGDGWIELGVANVGAFLMVGTGGSTGSDDPQNCAFPTPLPVANGGAVDFVSSNQGTFNVSVWYRSL